MILFGFTRRLRQPIRYTKIQINFTYILRSTALNTGGVKIHTAFRYIIVVVIVKDNLQAFVSC